jgi:cytochrome P450
MDAITIMTALCADEGRLDPYTWYARMHEKEQVFVFDKPIANYDAVAHGFAAVDQVLRDPSFQLMDEVWEDAKSPHWRNHSALVALKKSVFFMNAPGHTQMRAAFNSVFTARRVAALRPAIEQLTNAALDRMAAAGADGQPFDFMSEFAFPVPANIMGELIGVPEEDRVWYRARARAMGDILDFDTVNWRTVKAADTAVNELNAFFADLTAKRRADPHDDLISALVKTQDANEWLDDVLLFSNLITMFNAGFVTATNMFGHSVVYLTQRPHLMRAMLDQPDLVPGYVEEILRCEPPTHFVVRHATVDTEVTGVTIPAGSLVLVLLGAANRDPRKFPDPDEFDPMRQDNHQIAFGAGAHHCLGAALTRVEGAMGLPMLFDRFPKIEIAEPLKPPNQLTLRGYDVMPVRV